MSKRKPGGTVAAVPDRRLNPHLTVSPSKAVLGVAALGIVLGLLGTSLALRGQIESVAGPPPHYVWVSHGRSEGHLALSHSPAAAFSPDGSTLAVVNEDKIVLMNLAATGIRKTLQPHVEGVAELEFRSADYVTLNRLFILGSGVFRTKDKGSGGPTPTLAFQWDTDQDKLFGKVNAVGAGGGYSPPRYFPQNRLLELLQSKQFRHVASGHWTWGPGECSFPHSTTQPL